jgi:branched-chain amino acid transport system permease protein
VKALVRAAIVIAALFVVNGLLTGAFTESISISPYLLQVMCLAGINIILAVSLNLINGFTGQFSIGHAGFMAIGAYVSAYLSITFGPRIQSAFSFAPESVQKSVLLLVVLAVGAACAAIAGFLVGVPSLRLRGDYLAIVTLGFGEIIRVFILNIDAVGGARGLGGMPRLANFFWIYLFASGTIAVVSRIVNSSFGRTLIAIREDEIAAEAMGVNTTRHKVLSFVVSSAMAGIAGGLFALPDVPAHELVHVHPVVRDHHHDRDRRVGLDHWLGDRRRPLHHADRRSPRVRTVPDGRVLAPARHHHDRPTRGNPRPS